MKRTPTDRLFLRRRALLVAGLAFFAALAAAGPGLQAGEPDSAAVTDDDGHGHGGGSAMPPEIERIRRRGKLVVAMSPGQGLPLCAVEDGSPPHGLEPAMARAMAKSLGVELEVLIEAATPDDALALVREGKADMAMAGLTMTAERSLATPFGDPYIILRSALLVANLAISTEEGYIDIRTVMKSLDNPSMRIGVRKASYHEELAAEILPRAQIVPIAGGWNELVAALGEDRLDAVLSDELKCVRFLRQAPEETVYHSVYILKDREEYIAAAFHWRDHNLTVWHNAWLRQYYGDPYTMGEMMTDYPSAFAPWRAGTAGPAGKKSHVQ